MRDCVLTNGTLDLHDCVCDGSASDIRDTADMRTLLIGSLIRRLAIGDA
jgi:hypothetical protein